MVPSLLGLHNHTPVESLPAYFGAAYLINLPKRKDKLKSSLSEFAHAQWPVGPDGIQIYAAQTFTNPAGFAFASSRGTFHSHTQCIRNAQLLKEKSVLVMEDDIALAPSLRHLTPSIVAQLQTTYWDFLYLGHERTGKIGRANSRTTEIKLVPITSGAVGAHFYAVNGQIFTRLLEHLDRIANGIGRFGPMPIDGAFSVFLRENQDVRGLLVAPKLGWQRPSRSDNHPRFFDGIKPLRPLISALRNFKHVSSQWR